MIPQQLDYCSLELWFLKLLGVCGWIVLSLIQPVSHFVYSDHKLSVFHRFRTIKGKQDELKAILERFEKHQSYEQAFKEYASMDYVYNYLASKTKAQVTAFKQHVSQIQTKTVFFSLCIQFSIFRHHRDPTNGGYLIEEGT